MVEGYHFADSTVRRQKLLEFVDPRKMAAWVISRWVDRTLAIGVGMGTAAYCHYDLTGLLQKRGDAGLLLFDPKPKAKAPKVEVRRGSVSRARARALIVTSHAVSPVRRPRSRCTVGTKQFKSRCCTRGCVPRAMFPLRAAGGVTCSPPTAQYRAVPNSVEPEHRQRHGFHRRCVSEEVSARAAGAAGRNRAL